MLQGLLFSIFNANRNLWNVVAGTEIRVQTGPNHFRIPDVCVLRRSDPVDPIVKVAPLICIEVLSPSDTIQRMQERIDDYILMGVQNIWLIDPITRNAWIATADRSHNHVDVELTVPGTLINISLAQIFAELDDLLTQA
jgi:Uma2 family endonuclease